jgi:hypothetical protein
VKSGENEEKDAFVNYADYKPAGNVMWPMTVTTNNWDMAIRKIELNKPVDDTTFIEKITGK